MYSAKSGLWRERGTFSDCSASEQVLIADIARYLGCVQRVHGNSALSAQVSCQPKTTIKVISSRSRDGPVVEAPTPNQTSWKLEGALGRDK